MLGEDDLQAVCKPVLGHAYGFKSLAVSAHILHQKLESEGVLWAVNFSSMDVSSLVLPKNGVIDRRL